MTLIKSISGIRGTIGGKIGDNLTPIDIVKFAAAYGTFIKQNIRNRKTKIILGRDARTSGEMLSMLVTGALAGIGIDIIDIGLATTPTTEMAVIMEKADGGIILTASHNPGNWNALKLLNQNGEFLTDEDGKNILKLIEDFDNKVSFAEIYDIGTKYATADYTQKHIDAILKLKLIDIKAIKDANFKVAIDCVNSVGGTAIPLLLKALGVTQIVEIYCDVNGIFPHNPEPLPENLTELANIVKNKKADIGFAVDPDVDRLAMVCENGEMFGEEYTLVAVADYVLQNENGNTVSNLSSSLALKDLTEKYGQTYFAAAVGELNVVTKMKDVNAIIGGEGNGGVIYPKLHYGRDALVGIALMLSFLAKNKMKLSQLKKNYSEYFISKNKIVLTPSINIDNVLTYIIDNYKDKTLQIITIDGVKLIFDKQWIHLRKSNTEPIIRIYTESRTQQQAEELADMLINEIKKQFNIK